MQIKHYNGDSKTFQSSARKKVEYSTRCTSKASLFQLLISDNGRSNPKILANFFDFLNNSEKRTLSVSHQDTFVPFHTSEYPAKGLLWFLHAYTYKHSQFWEWCCFSNGLIPLTHPWLTMARNINLTFRLCQQKKSSEVKDNCSLYWIMM